MERAPKFLKDFSRKEHQSARDQTAADIRALRRRRDTLINQPIEEGAVSTEGGRTVEQNAKRLRALGTALERIDEMSDKNHPTSQESSQLKKLYANRLASFYDEMERRWEHAPYNKEQIKDLFSEQHLETLSLKEYTLLLKRFPSHLQTHVVRQGIRDHIGSKSHNARPGEYHNNFQEILRSKRLHSFLNLWLADGAKREVVSRFLKLDTSRNREDALYKLESFMSPTIDVTASLADQSAVHLALDAVADKFYGGETQNEIFFVFPALHIASQHIYSNFGNIDTLSNKKAIENDVWALSEDARGLSIEAGITFISASARVDPNNGSRYDLNERLEPQPEEDRIRKVSDLMDQLAIEEIYDMVQELQDERRALSRDELESKTDLLKQKIDQRFHIHDPQLLDAFLMPHFTYSLVFQDRTGASQKERVMKALFRARALYKEATQTISSKEYWERFFTDHPEQRPSKLYYYTETDPTEALEAFKQREGLLKKDDDKPYEVGFPENRLDFYKLPSKSSHYADPDERFVKIALDIIDERFPE